MKKEKLTVKKLVLNLLYQNHCCHETKIGFDFIFTGGPDEVREWTIRKWYTAPQAAGTIHTDLERTFILAQVIKYDDLIELGDENSVRAAGKLMQKGKDYFVEDGDIIYVKAADGKAR